MEDLKAELAAALKANDKGKLLKLREKIVANKWFKNFKCIKDILKPNPLIKWK